jgi:methyl-accepting chemotaxis protein
MSQPQNNTKTDPEMNFRERSGKIGHLKHQFLWCFIAIILVTTGVSIGLMIELGSGLRLTEAVGQGNPLPFLAVLRGRIVLGTVLIIIATGGVFLFLYAKIARPMENMAATASRMAEGCLGATIPDHLPNEIGRVGASVNSLAVNFQEMLILVWNQTEDAITKIRRTTHQMKQGGDEHVAPGIMGELKSARQDLETMQMMVRSFDLYDVAITESDVLTAKSTADRIN